jgi:hypothetical protein
VRFSVGHDDAGSICWTRLRIPRLRTARRATRPVLFGGQAEIAVAAKALPPFAHGSDCARLAPLDHGTSPAAGVDVSLAKHKPLVRPTAGIDVLDPHGNSTT